MVSFKGAVYTQRQKITKGGITMNIFEFAMKMELDGKAYYEKLAEGTSESGLKAIFTKLAADEQKHYDTIVTLKTDATCSMPDTIILNEAKNLFENLLKNKDITDSLKKSLDGYQHARKIEADSVRFYEDLAQKETNPELGQIFTRIAGEEKVHYNILDNLYDFVLEPQYFLAWREFSNIKEL